MRALIHPLSRILTPICCMILLANSLIVIPSASAETITYWEEEQPEIQDLLDDVVARYESHSGHQVRRSHFKTEDLRTSYQTAAIGGGGPPLILAPNDFAGVFATMGIIQTVDAWGKMKRFDPLTAEAITDPQGKSWGLPINKGNHLLLYVNKKLAPKAPQTVEDLIAAAKQATKPTDKRFGLAYNLLEPFWFVPYLGLWQSQPLQAGKPNLNTPAMRQALALIRSFRYDSKITPASCDYACAESLFLEGRTAFLINGDWAISKYATAFKNDLILAPLPRSKLTGNWMTPMMAGKYFMFNAQLKGKKLEAAKHFVEFLLSDEIQIYMATKGKRLPSIAALKDDKAITGDHLLRASQAAAAHAYPMPMRVELRAVWDAIRPQLQEVMADRKTPEQAAKIMQQDALQKIAAMAM